MKKQEKALKTTEIHLMLAKEAEAIFGKAEATVETAGRKPQTGI